MSKFTPGPWRITTDAQGFPQHLVAEGYTTVCSFLTSVKRMCPSEQIDANARLIAAAPALYEALEDLLADIENYQTINLLNGYNNSSQVNARAALALVGEQA